MQQALDTVVKAQPMLNALNALRFKGGSANEEAESVTSVSSTEDIVTARCMGRELAQALGFSVTRSILVATAISELARNIILYARHGEIRLARIEDGHQTGILITAEDRGPGIANVQRAMISGYSSSGGLGLGLSGVRRMVDAFEISSEVNKGTQVVICMWTHPVSSI